MLRLVSIEDFALIDRLEVEFMPGLNLITGETGSGKSILVDAVSLLVGARASQEMVRQGAQTARVEGLFQVPEAGPVREILGEAGIEAEGPEMVIRREISLTGSNRAFVNGRLANLSLLSALGSQLVDILGQHSQQVLLTPASHLDLLDRFGNTGELRSALEDLFRRIRAVSAHLDAMRRAERNRMQRLDLLRFQISEIETLKLQPGLDEQLEKERGLLNSAERRLALSREAYETLYEADAAILPALDRIGRRLMELAAIDQSRSDLQGRLEEAQFIVEEVAFRLRDYLQEVRFDPARLEEVEERLGEIDRAKRKYGPDIQAILDYCEDASREHQQLESSEEEMGRLSEELDRLQVEYDRQAAALSDRRRNLAVQLSEKIREELSDLAMKQAVFTVEFSPEKSEATEKGIDTLEFQISTNPGEDPRPLARIASGGELSRIMLALKAILSNAEHPKTLVFDEVDSGIGGRVATTLGEKLAKVARFHQVFCVTHLPQIAAFASQHFHVDKHERSGRTVVSIQRLSQEERVEELARMLAGERTTQTTLRQAGELLQACHQD